MNPTITISPDPYNILSLIQGLYSKDFALTYKKKEVVRVIPKKLSDSNFAYKKIEAEMKKKFLGANIESRKDGEWYKIRVTKGGKGSVHILTSKGKISEVLRPGMAYELYFQSVLIDGIDFTKNRRRLLYEDLSENVLNTIPSMNLSLVVSDRNSKIGIGNIKSSSRVGGENLKPDVIIYKRTGSPVRISLKQSNFFHWGGADRLNPRFSPRAKSLLTKAIQNGILELDNTNGVIFPKGVDGIRSPATKDEVKYYIFGEGTNTVEYVMVNAILSYHDDLENVMYMNADKIYKKDSERDITQLMNDTFLLISKRYIKPNANSTIPSSGPSSMVPYKGIRVSFVNRRHAYGDSKYNYIDI